MFYPSFGVLGVMCHFVGNMCTVGAMDIMNRNNGATKVEVVRGRKPKDVYLGTNAKNVIYHPVPIVLVKSSLLLLPIWMDVE